MNWTFADLVKELADESRAYDLTESWRWPHGPVCPHCGTIDHAYQIKPKNGARTTRTGTISYRRLWKCGSCSKQFSVTVGTVMEDSKIPLSKWLIAFYLVSSGKNAVSAHELHRLLGITYKSAWFMEHRIRHALEHAPHGSLLTGIVEADETYVGGKHKPIPGVGNWELKTPVVTLVERGGEARSVVMPTVNAKNLKAHLTRQIDPSADLMTDQLVSYKSVGREFASHQTVDHQAEEWARGDAHVNTAEGYFSQLKRSLDGTYHHVSPHHLHRYVAEFDYRYNTRKIKDGERVEGAIRKTGGKRLQYKESTGKA